MFEKIIHYIPYILIFSVIGYYFMEGYAKVHLKETYQDKQEMKAIVISLGRYNFFLHLWLFGLIALIITVFLGYFIFSFGFILGGLIQALTYKDRFVFIRRKKIDNPDQ